MTTPQTRQPKRPVFLDPGKLPWTPWVMDGTHFKLMNVDLKTGGFSLLLKVDPDNNAPVHQHLGAVEAFVLEGGFGYEGDQGEAGCYLYEAAGSIHQPTSPQGSVMFAVIYGPLVGFTEDGAIDGVVDAELMLNMARENGAADHLQHVQVDFS